MAEMYFYNDPLAACYMAKHYGMRFIENFEFQFAVCDGAIWDMLNKYEFQKIYIHPESHPILGFGIGDFVQIIGGHHNGECDTIKNEELELNYRGYDHLQFDEELEEGERFEGFRILERNGVTFFTPQEVA